MLQALKQPPKQKDSSYFFRYLSRMSNCETFVRSTRVSLLWDFAVIKNLNHTACIDKYYWRSLIKFIWSPNVFGEVFWVSMYNAQKLSATQICWCYQRFMISDNAIFDSYRRAENKEFSFAHDLLSKRKDSTFGVGYYGTEE